MRLLHSFTNQLEVILLIASTISAFVGETFNEVIVTLIVEVSAGVNFFQSYRSERAVNQADLTGESLPIE